MFLVDVSPLQSFLIAASVLVFIAIGTRKCQRTITANAAAEQRNRSTGEPIQRSELSNPE